MESKRQSNWAVGDQGEFWFASQLPVGWIWQPPRRDVGKDGLVVIRDHSPLHNTEFSVQVKTTENPTIRDGWVIKSGIPRSSVFYWFASPQPTLVIAVDIGYGRAWYSWHLDLFASPAEVISCASQTLSIRIPVQNVLDAKGWDAIKDSLKRHYGNLRAALDAARSAARLIPTVEALAVAVQNLVALDHAPNQPNAADLLRRDHDALFFVLHEQCQYRDALAAVRSLHSLLASGSDAHKEIGAWLAAFEAHACMAYPKLRELPAGYEFAGIEVTFAAEALPLVRRQQIEAALHMISFLSKSYLISKPNNRFQQTARKRCR
ncbi:MAG: DUF4365 domain-containing protein [Candidatus Aminicenantales bacterium]